MSSAALRGCGDEMYTDAALRGYGDDMYTDAALRGYGDDMYTDAALRGYGKRSHLVKGSPEAKAYMAKLRAMRTGKRGGGKKRGGIALGTIGAILGLAPTVISGARALYDAIKGKKGGRDLVRTEDERRKWIRQHTYKDADGKRQWFEMSYPNKKGVKVSSKFYAPAKNPTPEKFEAAMERRLENIPEWFKNTYPSKAQLEDVAVSLPYLQYLMKNEIKEQREQKSRVGRKKEVRQSVKRMKRARANRSEKASRESGFMESPGPLVF